MTEAAVVFAPAKINLGLEITGRYPNGYHQLATVFVPVTLFDKLSVSRAPADSMEHIWPTDADVDTRRMLALGTAKNPLLTRALELLRRYATIPPIAVTLTKRIPSPGGLGGASADAAAMLAALWRIFAPGQQMPADVIIESEKLGADIPFFLTHGLEGKSARLWGIGHELVAVQVSRLSGWICVPGFGFPTAQMFAHVRQLDFPLVNSDGAPNGGESKPNLALRLNEIPYSDEPVRGVRSLINDFDAAAAVVFPAESQRLSRAKLTIAQAARQFFEGEWVIGMTGSGAGLFAATEAEMPMGSLIRLKPVLQQRLGLGWRVFPFRNIGP